MIDHLSLGVRDLDRAQRFYDATLGPLGYRRLSTDAGSLGYGGTTVQLWILKVARPVPADRESGLHVCFTAPDRTSVDAFHKAALKHGGADNGAPGVRADYAPDYYAAFVIDPEGYRIEAYCKLAA